MKVPQQCVSILNIAHIARFCVFWRVFIQFRLAINISVLQYSKYGVGSGDRKVEVGERREGSGEKTCSLPVQ